jgi:hypothetical protein
MGIRRSTTTKQMLRIVEWSTAAEVNVGKYVADFRLPANAPLTMNFARARPVAGQPFAAHHKVGTDFAFGNTIGAAE